MFEIHEESGGRCIGLKVDGKLLHADYEGFVPQFEKLIKEHGSIRCCIELTNMEGYQLRAIWDEMKFDVKHIRQIERCAIVGDPSWHKWWTKLGKMLFPKTKVLYFEPDEIGEAWEWLKEPVPVGAGH